MPDTTGTRWYRRGFERLLWSIIVSVLSVPCLAFIVFGIASPVNPAEITFWAVMLAAVAAWVRLLLRAGIGVTPEYVLVRKATGRTKMIPWPQVTGFKARISSRKAVTISVHTSGGKRWHTMGCSFIGYSPRETWDLLCALEDERLAWVPGLVRTRRSRRPGPDETTPAWAYLILGIIVLSTLFAFGGYPLYAGITGLGPGLRASHSAGTAGYYIPRQERCAAKAGCTWDGEFRLPGGHVTRWHVGLRDVAATDLRAGVPVAARDTGADGIVYPGNDPEAWHDAAILIVLGSWGCAVFLVMVTGLGIRRLRHGNVAAAP